MISGVLSLKCFVVLFVLFAAKNDVLPYDRYESFLSPGQARPGGPGRAGQALQDPGNPNHPARRAPSSCHQSQSASVLRKRPENHCSVLFCVLD